MTSLVRSLKRAVSTSKDSETSSPQASPLALNEQSRSASLAASPSFSDFSLSVQTDAEVEYSNKPAAPERRSSLEDYLPSSPRWLRPTLSLGSATSSVPIPTAKSLPSAPSAPPQSAPARREGKIHGMDYYDYCELIRGTSL